jgi:hypothetical protein
VRLTNIIEGTEIHVYVTQGASVAPPTISGTLKGYARFVKSGNRLTSVNTEGADWPTAIDGNTVFVDTSEVWVDTDPQIAPITINMWVVGATAADVTVALFQDPNQGGGTSAIRDKIWTNAWLVETWFHQANWTAHFTRDFTNGTVFADITSVNAVGEVGSTSFIVPTGYRPAAAGATTTMDVLPVSRVTTSPPPADNNGTLSIDLNTGTCSITQLLSSNAVFERWAVTWRTNDIRPPQPPTGGAPGLT